MGLIRFASRFRSHFAPAFVAVCAVACGPSFQAIYEGNARFEHCYAMEENAQASMPDKATCWRDWSERYTYGQTRDRIHYATARYVALSQGMNAPTDEALMMAAPGETPRASTITAPTPTSAFAPPPKVLDQGAVQSTVTPGHPGEAMHANNIPMLNIDSGAPAPVTTVTLPASTCSEGCGGDYKACGVGCDTDGGPLKARSCNACLRTYRACMRTCFK